MEHSADLSAPGRRTLTCGRGTARALARASVRARLLRPRGALLLLVIGLLGGVPLVLAGYGVGGVVEGLASVLFVGVVLLATSYRRALASATTLCPAGAQLTVDLGEDVLRVRNAVGEQESPYSAFTAPREVAGQVLVPLRAVRAHLTLPGELLTPDDVAWLTERIARPEPAAEPAHHDGGEAVWTHQVELTDDVLRRLSGGLVRYRLLGRGAAVRALLALALLAWLWVVTGRWLVAVAVTVAVAAAVVLLVVLTSRRSLRRQASPQRTLRARFDDTHLHLDGSRAHGSLAFTALRRCVVHGDTVLLLTRTGILQVLPREVVPDDALARVRAAIRVGSAD